MKVSTISCCYGMQEYIARCIHSILSQTAPPDEIILVSDDECDYVKILADAGIGDARIKQVFTGKNGGGLPNAKNCGLQAAMGEVIAPVDPDDTLEPDYLAQTVPLAVKHGACLTPRKTVDLGGTHEIFSNGYDVLQAYKDNDRLPVKDYFWLPFGWQTVYQKALVQWKWEDGFNEDLLFESRIFQKIGYIPFKFYKGYRYHIRPSSICHNDDAPEMILRDYETLLARIAAGENWGFSEENLTSLQQMLAARVKSIRHYLADKAGGVLRFEPEVVLDILLYPQKS